MLRPCLTCGTPSVESRCRPCRLERERARNAGRPGHRTDHDRARRAWAERVASGAVRCSRCPELIAAGDVWDIDRRPDGWHPAHAACNRSAGGRHQP